MKEYHAHDIRNISLLGGSGSGKTTLAESMLFESGVIKRRGTIQQGNTVSDYFPVEKEYGYSVFSTVLSIEWLNKKLNIIDCPGSDDFVGGTVTSLNVTDLGLIIVNAQQGVEVGTQNHFRIADNLKKPVIFAINQIDHEKADFERALESIKEVYGAKAIELQYPLVSGPGFNAMIDVLKMKMYKWKAEGGAPEITDIPAAELDKAQSLRDALIEAAAENDETLLDKYLEAGTLDEAEMYDGIRKGLISCGMYPVVCVCGGKDMGVHRLMQLLGEIAPAADEVAKPLTEDGKEVPMDEKGATSIYIFKTSVEPHIGDVQYFRVMNGIVHNGDDLQNVSRNTKERISQLYQTAGTARSQVDSLCAGDIGCTVKLKDTRTGNTLNGKDCDYSFPAIKYPAPKYRRAIKPLTESDSEKLSSLLTRMHEEDPTWIIEQSKELKQTIIHGQGEWHLRTLKWRLENNDKMMVEFLEPRIPYRETITKAARADYRHKKQSGGAGQFGEVHLIVEPIQEGVPMKEVYKFNNQEFKVQARAVDTVDLEWGGKLEMVNSIVGGAIDARFMPAIMKGLMDRMEQGPLTGSYARDVRVIVYDGKMHPVDSNEISFRIAARMAFAEAFRNAGPKVLEPIYDIEVLTPGDKMGDVMSDLQGRRAIIMGMESQKGQECLKAKIPLKEVSSYSTTLSSLTGGRASFSLKPAGYELVPSDIQDALIKAHEAEKEE